MLASCCMVHGTWYMIKIGVVYHTIVFCTQQSCFHIMPSSSFVHKMSFALLVKTTSTFILLAASSIIFSFRRSYRQSFSTGLLAII